MNRSRTYLEIVYCQWDLFTKDQLDEDLVEGEVDDTRIKHSFGNELTNDSQDMSPLPVTRVSLARHQTIKHLLSAIIGNIFVEQRSGKETARMVDVWTW